MKSPRSLVGAVALAIVVTTTACTVVAAMGWLVGSGWLLSGHNVTLWIVGTGLLNAAVVITLALRKAAEDRKAVAPKATVTTPNPRRLSGPGGVYTARRR